MPCSVAVAASSGWRSMPTTTPVLSVTASGCSTVFVSRAFMPMWIIAMLGSLPVLFMFGKLQKDTFCVDFGTPLHLLDACRRGRVEREVRARAGAERREGDGSAGRDGVNRPTPAGASTQQPGLGEFF